MTTPAPNCHTCAHRRNVPGDTHSACVNLHAHVTANAHGVSMGWFFWPWNFDPAWLESCDGYSPTTPPAALPDAA